MRSANLISAVALLTGCAYEHRALLPERGPYLLSEQSEVREVYEVSIQWAEGLFRVKGGPYLFDRQRPSSLEIANMQRFGAPWRSPESIRTCQWLITDQSPEHEFFILALYPDICIARSIDPFRRDFRSKTPYATFVAREFEDIRINRIITCPWTKFPGGPEVDERMVPIPEGRVIQDLENPVTVGAWLQNAGASHHGH